MFSTGLQTKFRLGSNGNWAPYKYLLLRIWLFLSVFIFVEVGKEYDLIFSSFLFWFIETLTVYLATDNKIFRKIIPWMLFVLGMVFLCIYLAEYIFGKDIINSRYNSSEYEIAILWLSIWHFITTFFAIISINFRKYFKSMEKLFMRKKL